MYKIYCDGKLIYDPRDKSLPIVSGKVISEVNKTGEFTFCLPPLHSEMAKIRKLISVIKVMDDDEELYQGRVLLDESDMYGMKHITCEGELAYLLDSIQRPKVYRDITPRIYLQDKINQHNSRVEPKKHFILGIVDKQVMNYDAREDNQYTNTLDTIMDKLIKNNGGYLRVRHENGVRYLDYIDSFARTSSQTIRFGENILDLTQHISASDIVTILIPLGKAPEGAESGSKLTIESVNGGREYLENPEGIALYGRIEGTKTWEDVALPQNLKTKGEAYLKDICTMSLTIELTAVDLHLIDVDIDRITLGDTVRVVSPLHGLDKYMMVTKREYDLLSPENDKIVLGDTLKALSEKQLETQKSVSKQNNVSAEIQALGVTVSKVSGAVEKIDEKVQEIDGNYADIPEQISGLGNELVKLTLKHDEETQSIDTKLGEILKRLEALEGGSTVQ